MLALVAASEPTGPVAAIAWGQGAIAGGSWGGSNSARLFSSSNMPLQLTRACSPLGRRSTSRGRAARLMVRRPPRVPGSGTIDHHVTALAAERQGVGQAGPLEAGEEFWRRREAALGPAMRCCRRRSRLRGGVPPLRQSEQGIQSTPTVIGSALEATSFLGWLISRSRLVKLQRSAARRRNGAPMRGPRRRPSGSFGQLVSAQTKFSLGGRLGAGARSRCPTCRFSRRRPTALGRQSTSRGRAAH
jgi:hypothetical protein